MEISPKQDSLDQSIEKRLDGRVLELYQFLKSDPELHHLQDYANAVSIHRLGYNDHGPVHMRMVVLSALRMSQVLREQGYRFSLEEEDLGEWEDSQVALIMAGFLHDTGMSVTRSAHEQTGVWLTMDKITKILAQFYPKDLRKQVILRSLVVECILGHMATVPINSKEAGIILVADGTDMSRGRSRIPMLLKKADRVGDLHQYSSAAIDSVWIEKGDPRPLRIRVQMDEAAGFHQVEEVLIPKLMASPIRSWVEIETNINGGESHWYRI